MNLFLCYDRCSTCQKAERWLIENAIAYERRSIKEAKPSAAELESWWEKSALPLCRFFNTSGLLYKQMNLKYKLPQMTEDEKLTLLSTDGMLVKRPLLITEHQVLLGFKPEEWTNTLLPKKNT